MPHTAHTPLFQPCSKKADSVTLALTLEPPGIALYLKPPTGKMYPPLECIDFQGTMFFYLSY